MLNGPLATVGMLISLIVPAVVIRPILLLADSTNQSGHRVPE